MYIFRFDTIFMVINADTLKHKSRQFNEIFFTGFTKSCHNDNFRWIEWRNPFQCRLINALRGKDCREIASSSLYYLVWPAIPGPVAIDALQWRHNDGRDSVSNHQPHHCLLNRLFGCRSKKTSKLRVTGLCTGNSPHKGPVTRKMFPLDDVIMKLTLRNHKLTKS